MGVVMLPLLSSAPHTGRFNEVSKPQTGRIHSRVNHFESPAPPVDGPPLDARNTFGGFAPRFADTTRVHVGLVDGMTATEVARGLKPGVCCAVLVCVSVRVCLPPPFASPLRPQVSPPPLPVCAVVWVCVCVSCCCMHPIFWL